MVLTFAPRAVLLLSNLSPMTWMACVPGPMNTTPSSSLFANSCTPGGPGRDKQWGKNMSPKNPEGGGGPTFHKISHHHTVWKPIAQSMEEKKNYMYISSISAMIAFPLESEPLDQKLQGFSHLLGCRFLRSNTTGLSPRSHTKVERSSELQSETSNYQ